MNDISIAAYNETFRQSSDPVYAHTLMRNVEELRTFNPKLKDSAGGEVNKNLVLSESFRYLIPFKCGTGGRYLDRIVYRYASLVHGVHSSLQLVEIKTRPTKSLFS